MRACFKQPVAKGNYERGKRKGQSWRDTREIERGTRGEALTLVQMIM
jgi:hypothetical protein